jgi:hypothetical protein
MWQGNEVAYGGRMVVENGFLYAVGCQGGFLVENCRVARVPILEVLFKHGATMLAGMRGVLTQTQP